VPGIFCFRLNAACRKEGRKQKRPELPEAAGIG
jgi:hypothetical protein